MNVLSLFDGMSCGHIALGRAGIKVNKYYASEIDKYAVKVTMANYPNTIQLGDISQWREWDINWGSIDLLIGGPPCQGFSFAGKQLNFDDPRSQLFFKFADILAFIRARNPDVKFLMENVRMKRESLDIISQTLGVEPVLINSALVSAQNRQRNYWASLPLTTPTDKSILLRDIIGSGTVDREKSLCLDAGYYRSASIRDYTERSRRQVVFTPGDGKGWRKLTPEECEKLQNVTAGHTDHVSKTQRYKMLGNGFTVDVVAHILKSLRVHYG